MRIIHQLTIAKGIKTQIMAPISPSRMRSTRSIAYMVPRMDLSFDLVVRGVRGGSGEGRIFASYNCLL